MGVALDFLRQREDGSWEGDCELLGRATFGELQDLIFDNGGPPLPAYWEKDYDMEVGEGPPPYPATISKKLARYLLEWIRTERGPLLEILRAIQDEEMDPYFQPIKRLVEERLEEGYAIVISH